jgi:hypothetical protein
MKLIISFALGFLVSVNSLAVDGFIIDGQSNAVGPGPHLQPFDSILGYKPYLGPDLLFGNDYVFKQLGDPTDINTNQVDTVSSDNASGSCWPNMATNLDAHVQRTFGFVPCAASGTTSAQHLPGANHQDRSTLFGSMEFRTLQVISDGWDVKCRLYWQWEQDALLGISTNIWASNVCYSADQYFIDTGVVTMLPIPQTSNPSSSTPIDATTNAMYQACARGLIGTHHIIAGPDLSDILTDDSYHLGSDSKLVLAGDRWAEAILNYFYFPPKFLPWIK